MTAPTLSPATIAAEQARVLALKAEMDAAVRELWAAGRGPDGLTADHPIAHRFQLAQADWESYRWDDVLLSALSQLAAAQHAQASAEAKRDRLRVALEVIKEAHERSDIVAANQKGFMLLMHAYAALNPQEDAHE